MIFYFFRHGIAEEVEKFHFDEERSLTNEGIKKTRKAAQGLKKLSINPGVILTSPFIRAYQTAEILADVFKKKLFVIDGLRPVSDTKRLFNQLKPFLKHKEILLVGHEPTLTELISELLGRDHSLKIELKKSGAASVVIDKIPPTHPGTLAWLMTPKQLRKIKN